jgi:hypothetical protein
MPALISLAVVAGRKVVWRMTDGQAGGVGVVWIPGLVPPVFLQRRRRGSRTRPMVGWQAYFVKEREIDNGREKGQSGLDERESGRQIGSEGRDGPAGSRSAPRRPQSPVTKRCSEQRPTVGSAG